MNKRYLFLVGYDISEHSNRQKALRSIQGHALGGQKSFYECWLTITELHELMAKMRMYIDPLQDKVIFVRLDPRSSATGLGNAQQIDSAEYFYIQ